MKFKLIAIAFLLVSISFVYAFNADAPAENQTLKQLHQQRIEALTNAKMIYSALSDQALRDPQDALTAAIRLERAKFEAAETDKQRLESLEEMIKTHQQVVTLMQSRKDAARLSSAEVLDAQADLLAARIELEEFKLKMKGE